MSMQRRCDFTLCSNGKWYVTLGDFEYAENDDDCTVYGPFNTKEAAEGELEYHSNPGSSWTDDSGKAEPPDPDEVKLRPPTRSGGMAHWRF